jgi:hypothetical protein
LGFVWVFVALTVEQPDGVFAVVAADLAKLVENASSQRFGNFW